MSSSLRKKYIKPEDFFPDPSENTTYLADYFVGLSTDKSALHEEKANLAIAFLEEHNLKLTPYYVTEFACINSAVRKFFSENSTFWSYWEEKLAANKCYATQVHTMATRQLEEKRGDDAKLMVGLFDQYMAYALMGFSQSLAGQAVDERSGANSEDLIDVACEMGSFPALMRRCENNINDFKSGKNISLAQFDKDMHDLGFLYWEIGYIRAANYAMLMADVFLDKQDVEQGNHYLAQSAIKYLCAEYLHKTDVYSTYVLDRMTGGHGMQALFGEDSGVDPKSDSPLTQVIQTIFGKNKNLPEYRRLAMLEMQPFFPGAVSAETKTGHGQSQHILLPASKANSDAKEDPAKLLALLNQKRPPSPSK